MGLFYYFCLQPDCIDSTYPKPHFISGPSLSLSASIYMPHVSISTFTLDVLYSIPCLSYFHPSFTFQRPFFFLFYDHYLHDFPHKNTQALHIRKNVMLVILSLNCLANITFLVLLHGSRRYPLWEKESRKRTNSAGSGNRLKKVCLFYEGVGLIYPPSCSGGGIH